MDNTAPNPQNTAPASSKSTKGFLVVIAYVVFLVIGVAAGVGVDRFVLKNTSSVAPSTSGQAQSVESGLPVAVDLLKNPIVYEWWGSVEGTLVEKDSTSITLSKDGQTIKIPLQKGPGKTFFYEQTGEGGANAATSVTLEEVPLGANLSGLFSVVPGTESSAILGNDFVIKR